MTALASVADVQRVMGDDDTALIPRIQPALEAAQEWVRRYLGRNFDDAGDYTAIFYDVRDDAIVELPEEDALVTAVRVYFAQDDPGYDIGPNGYQVIRGKRVQLMTRGSPFWREGYVETSGSIRGGRVLAVEYLRVEVDYTATGEVPARVREATALIAASWVQSTGPEAASQGVQSESVTLDDYSHSITYGSAAQQKSLEAIPPFARVLLGNAGRSRVSVV